MYQIYSINTLKVKSLAELKAIAKERGITPEGNKTYKQTWINAIVDAQPKKVEQPKTEFDVVGDEVIADGEAIASIEQDDNLTQPWVVQINGVEIFRADTWAKCFHYVCWHYKQGTLPIPSEPADDYLHHDDQPIKLPQVGESHFIGAYFLRCVAVSGEYAAVWDVSVDGAVMGEIRMGWNTLWTHTLSFEAFAIPQEAIADLHDSLQKYQQKSVRHSLESDCTVLVLTSSLKILNEEDKMSKFVIGHGINNIAAYSDEQAAQAAAGATEPVIINDTTVPCTVMEIPEGEYFVQDGIVHHVKWNIQAPLMD